MLSTVGVYLRRSPQTREMVSFLRLCRPTISRLPLAQCVCSGSPSFFCTQDPQPPKEGFRSQVIAGGQRNEDDISSVLEERVPQLREAAVQVKDAVRHLKGESEAENLQLFGESRSASSQLPGDREFQSPSNQSKTEHRMVVVSAPSVFRKIVLLLTDTKEGRITVAAKCGPLLIHIPSPLSFLSVSPLHIKFLPTSLPFPICIKQRANI